MQLSLLLQYLLPHRLLSRLVFFLTRSEIPFLRNFLIRYYLSRYNVDLTEYVESNPKKYNSFNSFFTRALKPEARPCEKNPQTIIQPVDGTISQIGKIESGRIFQAKGYDFTVSELLGSHDSAQPYANGHFVTLYLSPKDYHRVHMPLTGNLVETLHIPGRLFSVAPFTVNSIPRLFARNERLVCHFESSYGHPFCMVLVGAMLVSSIETLWAGLEIPPYTKKPFLKDYRNRNIVLEQQKEMGRFNMGSTVILLFPKDFILFNTELQQNSAVRMGQRLGTVTSKKQNCLPSLQHLV